MPTQTLIIDRADDWMTIWLNRPEVRNALSPEVIVELTDLLTPLRDDRSLRGMTMRGKGGVFCAGGDIKNFKTAFQGGQSPEDVAKSNRHAGALFNLINTMPQVVVMLVEGAAIAGGLGMMCTGDVIVVTEDAKFAITETSIGLPPAQIAPFVVKRIGLPAARRYMLTGIRFDGRIAGEIGLADIVVADAAGLDDAEAEIRRGVKRCAPGANAVTKELALAAPHLDSEAMMQMAGERFAQCMLSDEGREGVASFLEKRKPRWAE